MKTITLFWILLLLSTFSYSQTADKTTACAVKMKLVSGMKMSEPVRLINVKEPISGDAVANGYQFVYVGKNRKPFVQIKAESIAGNDSVRLDTLAELKYLQGLNQGATSPTGSDIIRLSYNGFNIYGTVRNPETAGGVIESFVFLSKINEVLQLSFFASVSDDAGFQSNEYMGVRNSFLGEYTSKLRECISK